MLGTLVQGAGTPTRATANHGPGDDSAAIATGIPVSVGGGRGDDLFTDAGRPNFSTAVTFHGEAGFDSVSTSTPPPASRSTSTCPATAARATATTSAVASS